ncbi:MAG TPA: hypothetical protein VK816_03630 [Jatrophihabitantaceae bacterium]|jgi:hypothetical protein|nr:hypothetical protein [Jatrophihabitantaceae bacterium]
MTRPIRPVAPDRLATELASGIDGNAVGGAAVRVALDGPLCADPHGLAAAMTGPLRVLGRPAVQVRAEYFWRDAALRLEYGRTDIHSLLHDWLDTAALERELLDPLGPGGSGRYLPSLRDPTTNRATREPKRLADPGTVLIVSGELLLGYGLPFDWTIHLRLSPAARTRRTTAERAWTLPAFDEQDATVRPAETADVVVKLDDARHPAIG